MGDGGHRNKAGAEKASATVALRSRDFRIYSAARLLGLTRNALRYRLTQMGIE